MFSSNLTIDENSSIRIYSNYLPYSDGLQQGGAVTAIQSNLFLYGMCTLVENKAKKGGGILTTESRIVNCNC